MEGKDTSQKNACFVLKTINQTQIEQKLNLIRNEEGFDRGERVLFYPKLHIVWKGLRFGFNKLR